MIAGSRLPQYAALYLGAALISAFTIYRGGAPFDEGLILQAGRRVADGQLPYRDFLWAYGPAHPYLLGGWFEAFGTSLMSWRVLRVACDAAVAVAVYALARRDAPPGLALVGWLAAACAMAQPTSATPSPFALLLVLVALALVTRRPALRHGALAAGAVCALAAAWRLDFALYGAGAIAVALALSGGRRRSLAVFGLSFAGLTALVYLPFAIAHGPGDLYDSLIGTSLRERDYWTLPFPFLYDGSLRGWPPSALLEDGKDVLGYELPLLLGIGLALAAGALLLRWVRTRELTAQWVSLVVLAGGFFLYLQSRADEFHVAPLLVTLAALLPGVVSWAWRELPRPALAIAPAALLCLLALHGVANRLSALLLAPELEAVDVAVAYGAKERPAEARAQELMVREVQRRVPAGEPIYAVTRRSDLVRFNQPLVYVLTERHNPTDQDFGLQTSAAEQREIVRALEGARPRAVVRWNDPLSTRREPNLRGRPSGSRLLDDHLARRYRRTARYGYYEILAPRGGG